MKTQLHNASIPRALCRSLHGTAAAPFSRKAGDRICTRRRRALGGWDLATLRLASGVLMLISGTVIWTMRAEPIGGSESGGSTIQFEYGTATVSEDQEQLKIGVTRQGGNLSARTRVHFATLDGSAVAGLDYQAGTGTIEFGPGETEAWITLLILNDGSREDSETFTAMLSHPSDGASLGTPSVATVRIRDNDPGVRWTRNAYWATEGWSVSVTVERGNDIEMGAFAVDYATHDGSAKAGRDYQATAGTLSFAPGATSQTIVIRIRDDELPDGEEYFLVTLNNVQGNAVLSKSPRTTVNLLDNTVTSALRSGEIHGRWLQREPVTFRYASSARTVSVLGDLPELGQGDPSRSVPLVREANGEWSVRISLPANRTYSYRFYVGSNPISDPIRAKTRRALDRPAAKSIWFRSSWPEPKVHWRQSPEDPFRVTETRAAGSGREPKERLYVVDACGEAGREIEFFITDTAETQRDPEDGAYWTVLDVFLVQDGELFTYLPAAKVSPQRRDYDPNRLPVLHSSVLNGERRTYRVLLPRGYAEHPWRRYPVIYFHDGQWMWEPGFIDPEGDVLAGLVRGGFVGEMIAVGIDMPGSLSGRARDYLPPGDQDPDSGTAGAADRYVDFLTEELKPLIDRQYRTRPGPESTFTAGISYGGVVALYMGWDFHHLFTRVGAISGSFWLSAFPRRLKQETKREIRVYLDSGEDNFSGTLDLRNNFLGKSPSFVLEDDLRYLYARGRKHQLADFRVRLPAMLSFLYPATEEPNELVPRVAFAGTAAGDEGSLRLQVSGPAGAGAVLQSSLDLRTWEDRQSVTFAREPVVVSVAGGDQHAYRFYRVVVP